MRAAPRLTSALGFLTLASISSAVLVDDFTTGEGVFDTREHSGWTTTGDMWGGRRVIRSERWAPTDNWTTSYFRTEIEDGVMTCTTFETGGLLGLYYGEPANLTNFANSNPEWTLNYRILSGGFRWWIAGSTFVEAGPEGTLTHRFSVPLSIGYLPQLVFDPNSVVEFTSIRAVPEPASLLAMTFGALGLLHRRRKAAR